MIVLFFGLFYYLHRYKRYVGSFFYFSFYLHISKSISRIRILIFLFLYCKWKRIPQSHKNLLIKAMETWQQRSCAAIYRPILQFCCCSAQCWLRKWILFKVLFAFCESFPNIWRKRTLSDILTVSGVILNSVKCNNRVSAVVVVRGSSLPNRPSSTVSKPNVYIQMYRML